MPNGTGGIGKGGAAGNLGRVAPDLTGSAASADAAALGLPALAGVLVGAQDTLPLPRRRVGSVASPVTVEPAPYAAGPELSLVGQQQVGRLVELSVWRCPLRNVTSTRPN